MQHNSSQRYTMPDVIMLVVWLITGLSEVASALQAVQHSSNGAPGLLAHPGLGPGLGGPPVPGLLVRVPDIVCGGLCSCSWPELLVCLPECPVCVFLPMDCLAPLFQPNWCFPAYRGAHIQFVCMISCHSSGCGIA